MHGIPPSPRIRRVVAAGAATAAVFAAGLTLHHHTAATTASAAHDSPPATPPATDPLTGGTAAHGAPDHTGTAHRTAARALTAWSAASIGTVPGNAGPIRDVLRIPALGTTWAEPVYEGVGSQQLSAGIGHFPGTEAPGQAGNFALAGHRSGVADPPLRDITAITTGATIQVITATRITYTYTVTSVQTVPPTDVDVIAEVPGNPRATPTQADLTLVTCWPANGHAKRVVVTARLTSSQGGT